MSGQTLLITGASGGIGRALIAQATARGDFVIGAILVDGELSDLAGPLVAPLVMDVGDSGSVTAAFDELDRLLAGRKLNAVIHAAAIAPLGSVEFTPVAEFDRIHNINTLGAVRVLQAALPRLRGHGGRFIFISSLLGRTSSALVAPYSSSKHAIEAIADSARRENYRSDIHIVIAEPGVIQTGMFHRQAIEVQEKMDTMSATERPLYYSVYKGYLDVFKASAKSAITASACAAKILAIIDARKPRPRYLIGMDANVVARLAKILPDRWFDAILAKALKI